MFGEHSRGTYRPMHKTAAAVRTARAKYVFDATGAESTFIGTDAGLQGLWWKVAITAFTV